MLDVGDQIPEATVWLESRDSLALGELTADGPILLFFYLFDWSAT
jgi:peroxiredoxin